MPVTSLFRPKWAPAFMITIGVGILLFSLDFSGQLDFLEMKSLDLRVKLHRKKMQAPDEIVVVLIDDASLKAMNTMYGRWPWPRKVFADVIDFLSMCGAKATLIDVLFTETEFIPSKDNEALSESDRLLVEMTKSAGQVYHSAQFMKDQADEYNRQLLDRQLDQTFINRFSIPVKKDTKKESSGFNNFAIPFKSLYQSSKGLGIVSFSPDKDGVYRRVRLLFDYHRHNFPAFGLSPFRDHQGFDSISYQNKKVMLNAKGSHTQIPVNSQGQYQANLYGNFQLYSFSGIYLSYLKLLKGEVENLPIFPEELKDKIVFIGASAAGVEDLKHTSLSPKTPGVLLHASIYGNLITNDFLTYQGIFFHCSAILGCLILTVVGTLFIQSYRFKFALPPLFIMLWLLSSYLLFTFNWVINMVSPSLAIVSGFIFSLSYLNFTDGKERRKIKNALGQYVSPHVLSSVLKESKDEFLKAEIGTSENLTIFFSDIRDFTTISEKYSAEKVVAFLNTYLEFTVDIIFKHNGTLDKFIGDAIVAFWGAPVKDINHPLKAVRAAMEIRDTLYLLNQKKSLRDMAPLRMGIGIHTGDVILGNIGSMKKLDYTIIGDDVNLTSRIENLTKQYKAPILISQETYEKVKDVIFCRLVDYVRVKGRNFPVTLYEVLQLKEKSDTTSEFLAKTATEAFNNYMNRDFASAIKSYEMIIEKKKGDAPSDMFIKRCRFLMQHPPEKEWDGCFTHQVK